jgi:tetratricopeptide (TPR) repeat protein
MNKAVSEKKSRAERRRSSSNLQNRSMPLPDPIWGFVIFGCAFLLWLGYLLQIKSIPLFYHLAGDGWTYDTWAQRIAAGDWLGKGVFYQAPLYPYFLGVLQSIVGHDLWLIRLVQITLGAASCVLIFLVGQRLFARETGIASGLIVACYAPAIFFAGLIEKSVLDLFLLSLLLFFLARSTDGQHRIHWLAIGLVLGLFGLSRENALILVPVVLLWIGVRFSSEPVPVRLRWMGLFVSGLLVVLVPVGVRNLAVGGEFKLTTSQFGPNFFIGNNPVADGTYESVRKVIGEIQLEGTDAARLAERALGRDLTPGEVSDYWFRKSWNYIRAEPADWLRLIGKKWLMVWNAREVEDSDDFYIYQRWSWLLSVFGSLNHFGILAPLAAVGLWLTRNRWRELWLLYAITFAFALSVAFFYVFGRYRFPLVPVLALFAGAGVVTLATLYQQRAWRPLIVAAGLLVASAMIVNWPIYGISGPGPGGYNNLANAYYKQGRINDATQTALKAIELQPGYGVAHYNLGNIYAAQGRFDLAQRHFEEALRLYPNYAELRSNLGQLMAERGDLEGGIQQFRKAIELNPALSGAQLNLGVALAKRGRMDEAMGPLQAVVRLAPESSEAHFLLGSVYAAQSRYDEAAKSFNEALRIRKDFAAAHEGLAQVLSLQGQKEEAAQHHQEALRLMRRRAAPNFR